MQLTVQINLHFQIFSSLNKLIQMASILVSEAEKVYVLHGVQEDLRCDGRGRKDVRPIVVETDIGNQNSRRERIVCVPQK